MRRETDDSSHEREEELPFPESLCHSCAAPPKYIRTARSIFIHCPIFKKYPPQPVRSCPEYRPVQPGPED